jgi:hypothetical protein
MPHLRNAVDAEGIAPSYTCLFVFYPHDTARC